MKKNTKILSFLEKEGFDCLPCERVNLDFDKFREYRDSDEHPAEKPFEDPPLPDYRIEVGEINPNIPTILRYFLDGSRKTYKVADVIKDGKYLPLIAGQVAVGVMERTFNGQQWELKPRRDFCKFERILAFPDKYAKDDISGLEASINKHSPYTFSYLQYNVKPDRDPVDLGIAKIMSRMHDLEIATVQKMAEAHLLQPGKMLVIDGPLRFKKKFDLVQFRNVIGLSKSFRPSFSVGSGRRKEDVGAITSTLEFGERTSVFKTLEEEKVIGMWYLRIRPPKLMSNPLQGVIKMEIYATEPQEKENGFFQDKINTISKHILRERNVTPYGADSRWANHIYPIYLTERYLKSSFMSDILFEALF